MVFDPDKSSGGCEFREVLSNSNRTNPRSTSSMRDTECFVKVEMADICPDVTGSAEPNLCIHVGSIHVDLCPTGMQGFTNLAYIFLKDSMGGWVGDHQCR